MEVTNAICIMGIVALSAVMAGVGMAMGTDTPVEFWAITGTAMAAFGAPIAGAAIKAGAAKISGK